MRHFFVFLTSLILLAACGKASTGGGCCGNSQNQNGLNQQNTKGWDKSNRSIADMACRRASNVQPELSGSGTGRASRLVGPFCQCMVSQAMSRFDFDDFMANQDIVFADDAMGVEEQCLSQARQVGGPALSTMPGRPGRRRHSPGGPNPPIEEPPLSHDR